MIKNIQNMFIFFVFIHIILAGGILSEFSHAQELFDKDFGIKEEKFIYTADDRPDPFISVFDENLGIEEVHSQKQDMLDKIKQLNINGILWDEENPLVMINAEIFKESDTIEGDLKIKKIENNKIVFEYQEYTHEIYLIEEF